MVERVEGIVLDIIKHTERHDVVTLYTRTRGRMAFLMPASRTKSGRMRNAVVSLMAVVGFNINVREGKELYHLRNPEPVKLWHKIYSNPIKTSLLFFLAEFCNRLVRQYPPDETLWKYLDRSLETLEALPAGRIANFHIAFLAGLLAVVGIEPPVRRHEEGERFDMLSGEMMAPGHAVFNRRVSLLSEQESAMVPALLRMNYRNMGLYRFTRNERHQVLQQILAYYSVHLPLRTEYKTLPVLREMFD